jgi:hypothetical protein
MIVDDLDFGWAGRTFWPFEANAPLVVDPDAPLAFAIAFYGFEPDAGPAEIGKRGCGIELIQLALGCSVETRRRRDPLAAVKGFGPFVAKAYDQAKALTKLRIT